MSAKLMGQVFDLDLPPNEKFVLIAYYDHAAHNGRDIFPAIGLVASKTGYSEREVQRVTRMLESNRFLIADGIGPHGVHKWRAPVKKTVNRAGKEEWDLIDPRGDNMTPQGLMPEVPPTGGGDNLSPQDEPGVTSVQGGGDIGASGGVTPVSPKPSISTTDEPEEEEPRRGEDPEPYLRVLDHMAPNWMPLAKPREWEQMREELERATFVLDGTVLRITDLGARCSYFARWLPQVAERDLRVVGSVVQSPFQSIICEP